MLAYASVLFDREEIAYLKQQQARVDQVAEEEGCPRLRGSGHRNSEWAFNKKDPLHAKRVQAVLDRTGLSLAAISLLDNMIPASSSRFDGKFGRERGQEALGAVEVSRPRSSSGETLFDELSKQSESFRFDVNSIEEGDEPIGLYTSGFIPGRSMAVASIKMSGDQVLSMMDVKPKQVHCTIIAKGRSSAGDCVNYHFDHKRVKGTFKTAINEILQPVEDLALKVSQGLRESTVKASDREKSLEGLVELERAILEAKDKIMVAWEQASQNYDVSLEKLLLREVNKMSEVSGNSPEEVRAILGKVMKLAEGVELKGLYKKTE